MSKADTNYRTQMPQSQPYHDDTDEPNNTDILKPEEWEDYEDNTGVAKPFHNVNEDPCVRHYPSLDRVTTSPDSLNNSTSSPFPSPSFSKHHPFTDSHVNLISTSPSPSPPYSSRAPSPHPTCTSTKRVVRLQPRGIHHLNPATNKSWLEILQAYLSYTFKNPDILEEALETRQNGVTCVGKTMRTCLDGNEGMSKLGEDVIKCVLREQYYRFSIPECKSPLPPLQILFPPLPRDAGFTNPPPPIASAIRITNRVLSRTSLYAHPTIASCIRGQPYIPKRWSNIKEIIKEDLREDSTRIISRAVKAVIGAAYLDGGMESAKKVMDKLQMGIRLPPGGREGDGEEKE